MLPIVVKAFMKKPETRFLIFCLVGFLIVPSFAWTFFSCPPYSSRSSCEEACHEDEKICVQEMSDYLHDKDNVADRSFPFYMINIGCEQKYSKNLVDCKAHCN